MAKEPTEPLELALLNRIFLVEIWMNYTRGATLAELTEAFYTLRSSEKRTKGRINYVLGLLEEKGWIEQVERAAPVPRKYYRTTREGRLRWLLTPDSLLTELNDSLNDAGTPNDEVVGDDAKSPDSDPGG